MLWYVKRIIIVFSMGVVLVGCGGGGGGGAPAVSYTIGGAVSGLTGGTVVLQNNGGNNLSISANSSFTFSNAIAQSRSYAVTVLTQPAGQFCTVSGGTGTATINVTNVSVNCGSSCTLGTSSAINLSGKITFDRVLHNVNGGLDYNNITQNNPVRGAVVEAVCNASIVSTTTSDAVGDYSLSVPGGTNNLMVRVKAQMQKTGTPSWNFRVIDNTSGGALYSLVSSLFDTAASNLTLDLHAASGWGSTSYTSTRSAAPFAILDSVYVAFDKILAENPVAVFPALNLNWSVNNTTASGNPFAGQIETSYFDGTQIYLLGKANNDTDEYDDHVVIHEWAHYFEANFSRSDSIGGNHTSDNVLDIRLAFGEGFGNAYSAMASDDPIYADASGLLQNDPVTSFTIDMEDNCMGGPSTRRGWYSECSVMSILYDLYDATNGEGADTLTMGFTPLYDVLVNEQKNTPALTSIFSFIQELKLNNPGSAAAIDTLLAAHSIDSVTDIYGSTQVTNPPDSIVSLPVYTPVTLTAGADVVNVCSTAAFQFYNGYGVNRFITFTTASVQTVNIAANYTSGAGNDPDLYLYRNGVLVQFAESFDFRSESMTVSNAVAGSYVLVLVDNGNNGTPAVGNTCYNVTL